MFITIGGLYLFYLKELIYSMLASVLKKIGSYFFLYSTFFSLLVCIPNFESSPLSSLFSPPLFLFFVYYTFLKSHKVVKIKKRNTTLSYSHKEYSCSSCHAWFFLTLLASRAGKLLFSWVMIVALEGSKSGLGEDPTVVMKYSCLYR